MHGHDFPKAYAPRRRPDARQLKRKKQLSPPAEILLLLAFDTLSPQRCAVAPYSLRGIAMMSARGEQLLQLSERSEVVVRPIGPDDAPLLQAFVRRLSPRSRRFRFFVALAELSAAQLARLVNVDPARGFALVAVTGQQQGTAIVAEARYAVAQEHDNAEFAIAVADDFQRRGLGSYLANRLVATAWRRNVRRLFGEIKSDNRAMLAFAMRLGFGLRASLEDSSLVIAKISLTNEIGLSSGAPVG